MPDLFRIRRRRRRRRRLSWCRVHLVDDIDILAALFRVTGAGITFRARVPVLIVS